MKPVKFTYNDFRAKSPAFTSDEVRQLANAIRDEELYDEGEESGLLDLFYPIRNYWEGGTLGMHGGDERLTAQIETARAELKAGVFAFMGNNQCSAELGRFLTDPVESIIAPDRQQATRDMFKVRIEILEQVRKKLLELAAAIDAGERFAKINQTIRNDLMTRF